MRDFRSSEPIGFRGDMLDECRLDRDGIRLFSQSLGDAIEPLVTSGKPKAKKAKA